MPRPLAPPRRVSLSASSVPLPAGQRKREAKKKKVMRSGRAGGGAGGGRAGGEVRSARVESGLRRRGRRCGEWEKGLRRGRRRARTDTSPRHGSARAPGVAEKTRGEEMEAGEARSARKKKRSETGAGATGHASRSGEARKEEGGREHADGSLCWGEQALGRRGI